MDINNLNEIQITASADAFERSLQGARDAAGAGKTDEAARAFETMLATLLVRELSRGLSDGFFGDGPGADTFTGWFEEHVGATLSSGRGLGLAEAVRAGLIQKGAPAAEAPAELPEQGAQR